MVYNNADQLTSWPGMHSYTYDDNGALTAVKNAAGTTTQQSFTYHPTGLMNTATFNVGRIINYWDATEQRVKLEVGEDDYEFVFDVTASVPAVIAEQQPDDSYVYYVREPGGALLAMDHPTKGLRYYHFDELGSTQFLTDEDGNTTDWYAYDPWGSLLAHHRYADSVDQPYQYVGQLGYYTHCQVPDFGWLQLGVRFYEPEVGRFERRDPIRPRGGYYTYASAQPTSLVDPDGRFAWKAACCLPCIALIGWDIYDLIKDGTCAGTSDLEFVQCLVSDIIGGAVNNCIIQAILTGVREGSVGKIGEEIAECFRCEGLKAARDVFKTITCGCCLGMLLRDGLRYRPPVRERPPLPGPSPA